jgi:hypothetical protein
MRMRPVRHFSRALHQVSACVITSARHSQVRSPNMRTSQHIVAGSVRVVHICSSKSWLTWTNATGRNDLQTAKTLIPRKQSCSRYATIDDFSCTKTQADVSNSEGIPERLFFFLRCREQAKQQNNKNFGPTSPGGRARLFFSFFFFFIYLFILLIRFINSIQFNFVTYVP